MDDCNSTRMSAAQLNAWRPTDSYPSMPQNPLLRPPRAARGARSAVAGHRRLGSELNKTLTDPQTKSRRQQGGSEWQGKLSWTHSDTFSEARASCQASFSVRDVTCAPHNVCRAARAHEVLDKCHGGALAKKTAARVATMLRARTRAPIVAYAPRLRRLAYTSQRAASFSRARGGFLCSRARGRMLCAIAALKLASVARRDDHCATALRMLARYDC